LILAARAALEATGRPWVIENVSGARHLLGYSVMLCGSMLGLPIWRHRYFQTFPPLPVLTPPCDHSFEPVLLSGTNRYVGRPRKDFTIAEKSAAAGIDWMITTEIDNAIPPAYTEFIGRQLLAALGTELERDA